MFFLTCFSTQKFTFSGIVIDPHSHVLIKGEREKRLEPKVISLLVLLAENSGEVVTRQTITTQLWPDVIVGDEVISQLIYSLRNALGDDAKSPKFIKTIPKKGYCFIPKVALVITQNDNDLDDIVKPDKLNLHHSIKNWQKNRLIKILIFLLVCLFLGIIFLQNQPDTEYSISRILPLTQKVGSEEDFSLSPDKNKMVYVHYTDSQGDLYIRELNSNEEQQLTNDNWFPKSPLWLDSNTVIYIRSKQGVYQIIRSHQQQPIEILYESSQPIVDLAYQHGTATEILFTEYTYYKKGRLSSFKSLNLVNGNIQSLDDKYPMLPNAVRHPVYSHDNKTLYFFESLDHKGTIVSLVLASGEYQEMSQHFQSVRDIQVIGKEHLLIAGVSNATSGIWKLNIEKQEIALILPITSGEQVVDIDINELNQEIFYSVSKITFDQVSANINTQEFNYLHGLNSSAREYFAVYDQQGKHIYFISDRTGFYELWFYNSETHKAQQLTSLKASGMGRPVISKSQDKVALVYLSDTLRLGIVSLKTGLPLISSEIPYNKFPLLWGENDQSIYVSEHRGQINLYEYDVNTLTDTLVQNNAGLFVQKMPIDNSLLYLDYKKGAVVKKNMETHDVSLLLSEVINLPALIPGQIKVIGDQVLTVKYTATNQEIYQYKQDKQGNIDAKLLLTLPSNATINDFSSDGSKVLYSLANDKQSSILRLSYQ